MLKNEEGYKDPTPEKAIRMRGGVLREAALEAMDYKRPRIPRINEITEADEQIAVITWAAYNRGKWPCLERLYHTPNGGYRNAAEAVQLKRMGVKPGVPDLFLPFPAGGFAGLWLEMKTDTGRPTACQRDWIEYLRSVGYAAYICHGAGEAINAIEAYLAEAGNACKEEDVTLKRIKRGDGLLPLGNACKEEDVTLKRIKRGDGLLPLRRDDKA